MLNDLGLEDFFLWHGAEIANEPAFIEEPDRPLRDIDLPWFYAIAVVVLKLVMVIVIPLTEGQYGHEHAVSGAAMTGIRTVTDPMA